MLLVLVIFLFNRNTIETVLDNTGLMDHLTPDRGERTEAPDTEPEESAPEDEPDLVVTRRVEPDTTDQPDELDDEEIVVRERPEESDAESPSEREPEPTEPEERIRRSRLYFVEVGENSSGSLVSVVRPVSFVDSPLTETLETLLKGPASSEINKGLLSLIPEGTRLRSVAVRGDTAFIDFSEEFRFNTFGKEGYRQQIRQVVYTATEFRTVSRVQLTVDGQTISYLGPESPFVGEPLTRDSLP